MEPEVTEKVAGKAIREASKFFSQLLDFVNLVTARRQTCLTGDFPLGQLGRFPNKNQVLGLLTNGLTDIQRGKYFNTATH